MAAVLERLATVDPDGSMQDRFVHRIVRHSLLWFADRSGLPGIAVDGLPPALPAGACSNPEPHPDIAASELHRPAMAWYVLADAILLAGCPEAVPDLDERLGVERILPLVLSYRRRYLDLMIARANPGGFMARIGDASAAMASLPAVAAQFMDVGAASWRAADLPLPDLADPGSGDASFMAARD